MYYVTQPTRPSVEVHDTEAVDAIEACKRAFRRGDITKSGRYYVTHPSHGEMNLRIVDVKFPSEPIFTELEQERP